MRISTKGRYSLEALLYMALLPQGEYSSARGIAEQTGMSDGYLEQLFIPLRKSGIIKGVRGPQGGYLPGKPLEEIRVGDILRAVEGSLEPVACVSSKPCEKSNGCTSQALWVELYQEINDCLDGITLADLVEYYHDMDKAEYVI